VIKLTADLRIQQDLHSGLLRHFDQVHISLLAGYLSGRDNTSVSGQFDRHSVE
jgi:hypothetical protein